MFHFAWAAVSSSLAVGAPCTVTELAVGAPCTVTELAGLHRLVKHAASSAEFSLLREALARWQSDHCRDGKLPSL